MNFMPQAPLNSSWMQVQQHPFVVPKGNGFA